MIKLSDNEIHFLLKFFLKEYTYIMEKYQGILEIKEANSIIDKIKGETKCQK